MTRPEKRCGVWLPTGVNVRSWERLPGGGPALMVANHNSYQSLGCWPLAPLESGRQLPLDGSLDGSSRAAASAAVS